MSPANIAFVLTGSIAGYKACEVVSRLVQRGHHVRVVATEAARRFVGEATLEGLTGQAVLTDLFAPGTALEHIELTRWADLVVVCPATAHTLNRFAAGLADDLAGALWLAHDRTKPFVVAPAMNPAMWRHPATEAAVARLREWGVDFIPVGTGRTACGEEGEGRLAEPDAVVQFLETRLTRPARRLRVLVTSGGTAEPVDAMRVLTNTSTGRTGAGIAIHFAAAGHAVVLLRARDSVRVPAVREETFFTFAELDAALGRLLAGETFDAVIHAAAVSDFSIDSVEIDGIAQPSSGRKLDSGTRPVLRLRENPKLVEQLRARSRHEDIRVVAFKLTQGATAPEAAAAVKDLFARSGADFVVHNDLAARADPARFPAEIHPRGGGPAVRCAHRGELAPALERLLGAAAVPPIFSTPSIHAPLP